MYVSNQPKIMEFEKVFPELCTFGKYQKLIFFFILLPVQLSYFCHIYSHIFLSYQPQYWCRIGDELIKAYQADNDSNPNSTESSNSSNSSSSNRTNSSSTSTTKNDPLRSSRQQFEKIFLLSNIQRDSRKLARINENFQRYFFIPSIHLVELQRRNLKLANEIVEKSSSLTKIDLRTLLNEINYSLVNYIDSPSSCHIYNSSYSQLITFHNQFIRKFLTLLRAQHQNLISETTSNPFDMKNNPTVAPPELSKKSSNISINNKNNDDNNTINYPLIIACNHGWTYSYFTNNNPNSNQFAEIPETIVTKWNLVCDLEWFQLLALAAFLVGLLFGIPLCHILCFNVGYRRTYFLMLLMQCSSGTGSALVADFKHFCLLRFLLGLSVPAMLIVPSKLMVELCGVRIMSRIVFLNELIHLFGAILLTMVAYLIRDYRHLSVAVSAPFIVYLFLWWSFPESANYLLITGKIAQLEKTILDIAHTNLPYIDYEFDESLKRRIYVELAIYKEFMISSLLNDSFGNRLEQLMNENYVDFNRQFDSYNNIASTTIDSGSEQQPQPQPQPQPPNYRNYFEQQPSPSIHHHRSDIDIELHHHSDPIPIQADKEEFKDEPFTDDDDGLSDISLPSSIPPPPPAPNPSTSDLITKLYQHLNQHPNGVLPNMSLMNGKNLSEMAEIWSENGSLEHLAVANSSSRQRPSLDTIGSSPISWSVSNNASSSTNTTTNSSRDSVAIGGGSRRSYRLGPNSGGAASAGGRQCHSSLRAILCLPNMRRKFFSLLYLSMTHLSLNVAFNYLVLEFVNLNDYVQPRPFASTLKTFPSSDETVFHLFGFAIFLNLIATFLGWLLLSRAYGRKFTFFLANLLSAFFTLITAMSMSSMTTVDHNSGNSQTVALVELLIGWSKLAGPFTGHLPLVCYSIAKIFQTTASLVLVIWLYELLPPIADCSKALHCCFTMANLQLAFMPFLLYISKKTWKLSILLPEFKSSISNHSSPATPTTTTTTNLIQTLQSSSFPGTFHPSSSSPSQSSYSILQFPVHYLLCTAMLSLAGIVCLILPETGTVERLPHSVQEAEMFQQQSQYTAANPNCNGSSCSTTGTTGTTTAASSSTTSTSTTTTTAAANGPNIPKWYSPRVLFNFQPPIIHPSGILKKPQFHSQLWNNNNTEESSKKCSNSSGNQNQRINGGLKISAATPTKRKHEIKFAGKVLEHPEMVIDQENVVLEPTEKNSKKKGGGGGSRLIQKFQQHHRRHHHKPKRKLPTTSSTNAATTNMDDGQKSQNSFSEDQSQRHPESSLWSTTFDHSSMEHQTRSTIQDTAIRPGSLNLTTVNNHCSTPVNTVYYSRIHQNPESGYPNITTQLYDKFGENRNYSKLSGQIVSKGMSSSLPRRHSDHYSKRPDDTSHAFHIHQHYPHHQDNNYHSKNANPLPSHTDPVGPDHLRVRSNSEHDISPSTHHQRPHHPGSIHLVLDPSSLLFSHDQPYQPYSQSDCLHHNLSLPRINSDYFGMSWFDSNEENQVFDMMAMSGGGNGQTKVRVFDVVDQAPQEHGPTISTQIHGPIDSYTYSNFDSDPNLAIVNYPGGSGALATSVTLSVPGGLIADTGDTLNGPSPSIVSDNLEHSTTATLALDDI